MTTGFARVRRGGAQATFDVAEASLLAALAGQVIELLRDGMPDQTLAESGDDLLAQLVGIDGSLSPPDDPVLARLLPDGYSGPGPADPTGGRAGDEAGAGAELADAELADANADFRRYTERGLREGKVANAQAVLASLRDAGVEAAGPDQPVDVELDAAGVQAWVRCLTDLRLAIGTRLGVAENDDDRWDALAPDDPASSMHDVYDWLGYVQETLVHALR